MKNPFGDDLKDAVMALGWTKPMWDETVNEIPKSDCAGWMDLSSKQKWAVTALGYSALKWDLYPFNPKCPTEEVDNLN